MLLTLSILNILFPVLHLLMKCSLENTETVCTVHLDCNLKIKMTIMGLMSALQCFPFHYTFVE